MVTARQIRLAARPIGLPQDRDFTLTEVQLPDLTAGQFIVAVEHVSVDPAMRTWISGEETYRAPVEPGDLIPALAVGRVARSRHPGFPVGAAVRGGFGVQDLAISDGAGVDLLAPGAAPVEHLGLLGISGLSAYVGLFEIGGAAAGETVLISGAAGAVGGAVGQLAKIQGCRVIGVAGGAAKRAYLVDELGFDAALDYRAPSFAADVRSACPGGADVVFDNVGGGFLEAALDNLALQARIVICGGLSQYNSDQRWGPPNYLNLVVRRASMAGFLVHDHARLFPEALALLASWRAEGRLRGDLHIIDGLASFPRALRGLFEGVNTGKLVLAVGPCSQEFQ